jgi:integrase-like protein
MNDDHEHRPPGAGSPPKLLDRVRQIVRMKHYSRRTESAYVDWIRRYIVFHHKKHPSTMGAARSARFFRGWRSSAA